MHPDPAFRIEDRAAMRAFVRAHPFGMLVAPTPEGLRVAHLPVVWAGEDRVHLHLSRRNALAAHLDGATALFVATGPNAYVSPDWYDLDRNQVPTWNYAAVELEGRLSRLDDAALIAQVDAVGAMGEGALAPKPAWTRDKMEPGRFEAMLGGIVGFDLAVTAWRGTMKMSQNKPAAVRTRVAGALDAIGRGDVAALVREACA